MHLWRLPLTACAIAIGVSTANAWPSQEPDAALRDYLSGNGLLNRGMYEMAAAEYRKFLAEHADHEKAPVARYGLAVCLFRTHEHEAAAAELTRLQRVPQFTYAAEVETILGQCRLAQKQFDAAAACFQRVVEQHGAHDLADDAAAAWCESLYMAGQFDAAAERCKSLASRWPDSPVRERSDFFWGLSDMNRHDYAAASERLAALLQRFPKGAFAERAGLMLAQCSHQSNALDAAAAQYRQLIKSAGDAVGPDALIGLGTLLLQQGKAREAGSVLDQLMNKYPQSAHAATARLHRGRAWLEQDQFDRACEAFEAAGDASPDLADDAAYWSAKSRLRQGDFARAAKLLERAIKTYAASELLADMCYDRAVALSRSEEWDAAAAALDEFLARFSSHAMAADALHLLAAVHHQRRQYDASGAACRKFLDAHRAHALRPAVAYLLAENQFLAGKFAESVEAYRQFLTQYSDDGQVAKAKQRLGTALYRLERFEEAEKFLAEASADAPQDKSLRSSLLALGDIRFSRGEWKEAEKTLREYLSRNADAPGGDDAMLKLGLAQARQERHGEAQRTFERLIERFPDSPHAIQAIFERGQSFVAQKKWNEAADAFEQVLARGADSRFAPHALNHLGAMALHRKEYARAAQYFERVVSSGADEVMRSEAAFQRGMALLAQSEFEGAADAFSKFLKQHGTHARAAEACAQWAIALSRLNRHDEAIKAIDRAQREFGGGLSPELRSALLYEKAWCLRESGKSDAAAQVYRELVDADVDNPHAILDLAAIEMSAKRFDAAAAALRKLRESAVKGAPDDIAESCLYRLAACEFELGRFKEAAPLFEELIQKFPTSGLMASASSLCGEALVRLNQHQRAAAHLSRVVERFRDDPAVPSALLRLGECHAAQQHWPGSEEAFSQFLDRFGDHEQWFQAQFGVGWARENQGRHDEAISAYRQVVERHKGPTAARAQFQIGECLFAKGRHEEAARELLKVDILYAYPEWSAAALYEAGRCFEKLSKPGEARTQYKQVSERFKDTRWATLAAQRLAQAAVDPPPGR